MIGKVSKSDFHFSIKEISKQLVDAKQIVFIAFLIFIVNFGFKAFFVSDGSFWYDEIFSVFHSQKPFREITHVSKWDIAPPFYYYLLHVWMKFFGMGEVAVRMLSVLFSSLAGGALFLFTYRYFNKETAIFSSILFFTSNILFFYSQEARTYSLLVLFAIVSSHVFLSLFYKPTLGKVLLLGVINWAAIYSQYIFVVIPFIQGLFILIHFRKRAFVFFALSGILTLLIFNKWLIRIYEIFGSGGNKTISANISLNRIWLTITELLSGQIITLFLILFLTVGLIFYFIRIKSNFNGDNRFKFTYSVLWGVGTFLLMLVFGSRSSLFISRYMLVTLIGFIILISFLASFININKYIRFSIYVLIFVFGLFQVNYNVTKGMDYKNAMVHIKELKKNCNTLIVLQTIDLGSLFAYYYDIEIFKQYHKLGDELRKENVLMFNSCENVDTVEFSLFDQVVHVQTFQEYTDPSGTLESFFKSNLVYESTNSSFDWVKISLYRVKHIK